MAKYSKKQKISKKASDDAMLDLCNAITHCKNISEAAALMSDLFSEQEVGMIAKRLQIAQRLLEEVRYDDIQRELRVSSSTIARVNIWLQNSGDGFRKAYHANKKFDKETELVKRKRHLSEYEMMKRRYGMYYWPELLLKDVVRYMTNKQRRKLRAAVARISEAHKGDKSMARLMEMIEIDGTDPRIKS